MYKNFYATSAFQEFSVAYSEQIRKLKKKNLVIRSTHTKFRRIRVAGWSLQHGYHSDPTTPKLQHKSSQEQYVQCGNSTE